ncbi:MAG TPA: hydroxymethylbilane synthase [Candidatus Acidoferrales bacterium]|nr:hydroxymethylbilane synthase [Candidatus Acidoferrales bacterium]
MNRALRLGSRGSRLALAQSEGVAELLRTRGHPVDVITILTPGDHRLPGSPLGDGVFVTAIEAAMTAGEIDLAVHSAKDLALKPTPGLLIGAFPERGDARDALVTARGGGSLSTLVRGAEVGTDSARRRSFLLRQRGDLSVIPMVGNVDRRLARLDAGQGAAILLAAAGIDRLGLGDRIDQRLEPELMAPAPAQGALAVQCRVDDQPLLDLLAQIDDRSVRLAVLAERAVLDSIGATCGSPIGALATQVGSRLHLLAAAVRPDGARSHTVRLEGGATEDDAMRLGAEAGRELAAVVEFPR